MDIETQLAALRLQVLSEEDKQRWPRELLLTGARVISPQNEAAALSRLLQECKPASAEERRKLHDLCDSYGSRTSLSALQLSTDVAQPCANSAAPHADPYELDTAEARLAKWCTDQGIITSLAPALFTQDTLQGVNEAQQLQTSHNRPWRVRGLATQKAAAPGHVLASIPEQCLITYQTALDSDLGAVLRRIPSLDDESAAVVWTMIDRHDPDSRWAPFWASLPRAFGTGLGVPEATLRAGLSGSPDLLDEALAARAHIRQQFAALGGVLAALTAAYPQHIKAEQLTWRCYLWAVQLWYAYAIQVQGADGVVRPCLAPLLSLANHSPWPACVHFSRVDERTKRLNVRCFRSIPSSSEVTLSYGPLPNGKLLLFYGFTVVGNPYDEARLELAAGMDDGEPEWATLAARCSFPVRHAVRAWGPLPPALLAAARLRTASRDELQALQALGHASSRRAARKKPQQPQTAEEAATRLRDGPLSDASEARALALVLQAVDAALHTPADDALVTTPQRPGGGTETQADDQGEGDTDAAEGFLAAALVHQTSQRAILCAVRDHLQEMLLRLPASSG